MGDEKIILGGGQIIFGGARLFWEVQKSDGKRCPTRSYEEFHNVTDMADLLIYKLQFGITFLSKHNVLPNHAFLS